MSNHARFANGRRLSTPRTSFGPLPPEGPKPKRRPKSADCQGLNRHRSRNAPQKRPPSGKADPDVTSSGSKPASPSSLPESSVGKPSLRFGDDAMIGSGWEPASPSASPNKSTAALATKAPNLQRRAAAQLSETSINLASKFASASENEGSRIETFIRGLKQTATTNMNLVQLSCWEFQGDGKWQKLPAATVQKIEIAARANETQIQYEEHGAMFTIDIGNMVRIQEERAYPLRRRRIEGCQIMQWEVYSTSNEWTVLPLTEEIEEAFQFGSTTVEFEHEAAFFIMDFTQMVCLSKSGTSSLRCLGSEKNTQKDRRMARKSIAMIRSAKIKAEQVTIAFLSIKNGAIWNLKLYLEGGGNPNAQDSLDQSLLHCAAALGQREAIFLLLCFGANPMIEDASQRRPLHIAVVSKQVEVVCDLVQWEKSRCVLDCVRDIFGQTPADLASSEALGKIDLDLTERAIWEDMLWVLTQPKSIDPWKGVQHARKSIRRKTSPVVPRSPLASHFSEHFEMTEAFIDEVVSALFKEEQLMVTGKAPWMRKEWPVKDSYQCFDNASESFWEKKGCAGILADKFRRSANEGQYEAERCAIWMYKMHAFLHYAVNVALIEWEEGRSSHLQTYIMLLNKAILNLIVKKKERFEGLTFHVSLVDRVALELYVATGDKLLDTIMWEAFTPVLKTPEKVVERLGVLDGQEERKGELVLFVIRPAESSSKHGGRRVSRIYPADISHVDSCISPYGNEQEALYPLGQQFRILKRHDEPVHVSEVAKMLGLTMEEGELAIAMGHSKWDGQQIQPDVGWSNECMVHVVELEAVDDLMQLMQDSAPEKPSFRDVVELDAALERRVSSLREYSPLSTDLAVSLSAFAAVHRERATHERWGPSWKLSKQCYEEAFAIWEAKKNYQETAQILSELACLYDQCGALAKSLKFRKQSLNILENNLEHHHPSVAEGLEKVAQALIKCNSLQEAIMCLEEALRIREIRHGPDHPTVVLTLKRLGAAYSASGDSQSGIRCQEFAVRISSVFKARLDKMNSRKTKKEMRRKVYSLEADVSNERASRPLSRFRDFWGDGTQSMRPECA